MDNSKDQGTMPDQSNSMNHVTFFWGKQVEILFPGFPDHNLALYILSLFFVAVLAATLEALKAAETGKLRENPRATWLIQSGLHMLQVGLTYMVMLSVMSYNVGIFLAAVAGHTIGFLVSNRPVAPPAQYSLPKERNHSTNSSLTEA